MIRNSIFGQPGSKTDHAVLALPAPDSIYAVGMDWQLYEKTPGKPSFRLFPGTYRYRVEEVRVFVDNPSYIAITGDFFDEKRFGLSTDAGKTWRFNKAPAGYYGILEFHNSDPNILYMDAHSPTGTSSGVARSDNAGRTWKRINGGINANVIQLVVDPRNGANLFIITERGSLYRSNNSGNTWERVLSIPSGEKPGRLAIAPGVLYMKTIDASYNYGVFASYDGATSWVRKAQFSQWTYGYLNLLSTDKVDGKIVFIGGGLAGLFRSLDGGKTWNWFDRPIQVQIEDIFINPFDPKKYHLRTSRGIFNWTE